MATIARIFLAAAAVASIFPAVGCSRTGEAGPMRLVASISGPGQGGVDGSILADLPLDRDPIPHPTPETSPRVRLETSLGTIVVELRPDWAPNSVSNFQGYVRRGHYDGTIFHAVAKDRSVIAGRYMVDLREKTNTLRPPIQNEARVCSERGIRNERGTLGMMRKPDNAHSVQSEFFINVANNPHLDYRKPTDAEFGYCVFGRVIEGMDIVDAISEIHSKDERHGEAVFSQLPKDEVIIRSARMLD
jgi:cyclophilin family peptidyl-prolyl cis-trans isomerase